MSIQTLGDSPQAASSKKQKTSISSEDVIENITEPNAGELPMKKRKQKKDKKDKGPEVADNCVSTYVGSSIDAADGSPKSRKSSSKRKNTRIEETTSTAEQDDHRSQEAEKVKKRKGKGPQRVDKGENEESFGEANASVVVVEDTPKDATKKKKSRKSKREDGASGQAEEDGEEAGKKIKKEKRKRTAEEVDMRDVDEVAKEHKKKRKRKNSEFMDPNEDESLGEQARKALHYAYTQFHDHANWKFNKARQNWLIRNVWSAQAVPDAFMPLLTRYLADVKGGARESLMKTCQDILASPPSELTTTEQNSVPSKSPEVHAVIPSSPVADDEMKRQRATAIIAAFAQDVSDVLRNE